MDLHEATLNMVNTLYNIIHRFCSLEAENFNYLQFRYGDVRNYICMCNNCNITNKAFAKICALKFEGGGGDIYIQILETHLSSCSIIQFVDLSDMS
jgi:hypothetical protein